MKDIKGKLRLESTCTGSKKITDDTHFVKTTEIITDLKIFIAPRDCSERYAGKSNIRIAVQPVRHVLEVKKYLKTHRP